MHIRLITKKSRQKLEGDHKALLELKEKMLQIKNEAHAQGDLRENADYHIASEKLTMINQELQVLEYIFQTTTLINVIPKTTIDIGATVTLLLTNDNSKHKYIISDEFSIELAKNKISILSPMAQAMLHKKENDTFTIAGKTAKIYKIEKISYEHLDDVN